MSYALNIMVQLSPSDTGKTLYAILKNSDNSQNGNQIETGFTETDNGEYIFNYTFPDAFRGWIEFYDKDTDEYQTSYPINGDMFLLADVLKNTQYDGITQENLYEMLLAFMSNKVTVTSNSNGTRTISYKNRDGNAEVFNVVVNVSNGSRDTSGDIA